MDSPDRQPEPRVARRPAPPPEEPESPQSLLPDEFEDEPPGAYLRELGVGNWNVVWSALNLLLTSAVAVAWHLGTLTPQSEWRVLARLVWALMPALSAVVLMITCWQAIVGSRPQSRWRLWITLLLGGVALACWYCLREIGPNLVDPEG